MAKTTLVYKPKGYSNQGANFDIADTTSIKDVATASADDSIIKSISIVSDDVATRYISLIVNDGANDRIIDTIEVPAGAGTDGITPAVDGLANTLLPLDSSLKKILPIMGGGKLCAKMVATITAAKTVTLNVIQEDF